MRTIEEIFQDRTCYSFAEKKVEHDTLKSIYDLMKLGPTSANTCPLRMVFVESEAEKEKLIACAMDGNKQKIQEASCTVIFAYDLEYYEKMDYLFPQSPGMKKIMSSSESVIQSTASRNSILQAAYFMVIARGFGLDLGPMSGFDNEAVDKVFFKNTAYKSDFLCNIGYKKGDDAHDRLPRLAFDDACQIV